MDCWFWNIDRRRKGFFHNELQEGRLRQGWSYDEQLNLEVIRQLRFQNQDLTDRQQAAWKRCKDMVTRITPGDLVIVKNVPDGHHFGLVRVLGEYRFDISQETGDQGHILPVEYLGAYHKNAEDVPTPMIRALDRAQHPIRRTLKHKESVIALSETDPKSANTPEPFKAMIDNWRSELSERVQELAHNSLKHKTAERLVLEMLRNDGLDVEWTAGPNERGADLETEVDHRYGLSTNIAIQVKFHRGTERSLKGLKQIEQAFEERSVDAGLLVTFASKLSEEFTEYLTEIKHQYRQNIEVLYGDDLYTRLLELIADPEHVFEDE